MKTKGNKSDEIGKGLQEGILRGKKKKITDLINLGDKKLGTKKRQEKKKIIQERESFHAICFEPVESNNFIDIVM